MDPLGAVFYEYCQNFQMGAIRRCAVNHITNGDYTDIGTFLEIAWSEGILADFVEGVARALPGAKKVRGVHGNSVVQGLFTFVDICVADDVILGDRLDDGLDIRLSVRQLDSEARTPAVTLVFARQGDIRG